MAKHARSRPKYPRAVAFLISALLLSGGFVSISHASVPPSITSISPTSGTAAGGTTVTVSGSNFDPTGTATTVRIDGVDVTPSNITSTSLTFVTPVRPLGSRTVGAKQIVVTTGTGSSSETVEFTYRPILVTGIGLNNSVVRLNSLASRSQAKPITRAGQTPFTVTGTDSLTSETYSYVTDSLYSSATPAYRNESHEAVGTAWAGKSSSISASINMNATGSGRSGVVNLSSSGNCSTNNSVTYGGSTYSTYCSVFGPEIYSEPFYAVAGQALSFEWSAVRNSDDYEIYAFLVKVTDDSTIPTASPSNHTLLVHSMGKNQPFVSSSGNITESGTYRFRFVNGSYDATGGFALGSNMYIDPTIIVGNANVINFNPISDQIGATGTFDLNVTSTAGGAISMTSSTTGICTVSTSFQSPNTVVTVTKLGTGTCILNANQGATGSFAPASRVQRAFEIRAAATAPTAPAITSIVGENGQLRVNFNVPDRDGGATITNYRYRIGSGSWVVMNPPTISSPIIIPGLTNGTAYSITLSAINSVGDGTASTSVSGTPQASAPGAPTISAVTAGDQTLSVAFTAPGNDGGSSITNYEYSINGSTWVTPSPAVTTSPIVISGLTNGTTYPVRVRAVNSSGSGAASNTVSASPTDSLGAPTLLSVTPDDLSLIVSFNAPGSNGGSPITNYEYSIDGSTWITPSPAATTSPIVIPGLTNGTAYPVRIRAVNSAGPGAASNSITETPAGVAGSPSSGSVSTPGPALPTPSPTPSPSVSPRPVPQPTPARQPTAAVPSVPLPVATPRPSVTAAPTPLPTTIVTPVAIPELRASPGVVFNRTNPISQALVDILSSPLAYTRDGSSLSLPTMTPNQSVAIENGAPVSAPRAPTVNQNGYLIQGSNWQVSLEARSTSGEPLELDESGNLVLNSDRLVQFQGTGFAPGSTIKVWLFSDPASIAKVTADQNGSFSGSAKLSADIPEGEHTVQLNGLSTNGQIRSVALGVVVQPDVVATPIATPVDFTQLWNLVLVTAGVVMMFFLVLLARKRWFLIAAKRRKRKDEEQRKAFAMGVSEATPKQQFPNDSRRRIGAGSPPNRKRSSFKPKSA